MVRKSKHKIWLRDVQLYVFCEEYQQHRQRKGREGAFELDFINEKGELSGWRVFCWGQCADTVVGSRRQVLGRLLPAVVARFPYGFGEGRRSVQVERRCATSFWLGVSGVNGRLH